MQASHWKMIGTVVFCCLCACSVATTEDCKTPCDKGFVCVDGDCHQVCATSAACKPVEECRLDLCWEIENPQCSEQSQCDGAPPCRTNARATCFEGMCQYSAANDGDLCNHPSNPATTNDGYCDAGECLLGSPVCGDNDECAPLTCIDSACTPRASLGGVCDAGEHDDCTINHVCVDSTCLGKSGLGIGCGVADDLCEDTCIAGVCQALSPACGACDDVNDCASSDACEDTGAGMQCSIPLTDVHFSSVTDLVGNGILQFVEDALSPYAGGFCTLVEGCTGYDQQSVVTVSDSVYSCRCDTHWGCEGESCTEATGAFWERVSQVTCTGCPGVCP